MARKVLILLIATAIPSGDWAYSVENGVLAFPGAEGFGAYAKGGRGGKVLMVRNLADYDPEKEQPIEGSLREACAAKGARIVTFRLSGTIELKAPLIITEPFLTLAGQSASGEGICLKNFALRISTHDVVIRYLRIRPGDQIGRKLEETGQKWETDAISIEAPSRDVILDHCSASWANDEVCSTSGAGITDVTVQWCIISESLSESTHPKGKHGFGSLIKCNGRVTYHHNLYAFHQSRCPRPGTYGEGSILFDYRNNVMYKGGSGYSAADPVRMNFIANYHPDTPFTATDTCHYYASGNQGSISRGVKLEQAFEVAPVATDSAAEARERVLNWSGAVLPKRDTVDQRVVGWIKAGKGGLINSAEQVGGWPELKSTPAPRDSDYDGMPDEWENKYGLDAHKENNNNDLDGDGYTDIEEYLNGSNPNFKDAP